MISSPYLTLSEAILTLKSGQVVGIPTETVYGLAADITQEQAVRQIFSLKSRPADHPLIVHIADEAQLDYCAEHIPPYAKALARAFWPGPLTLVLPKSSHIGHWVTGGQDTVGVRMPNHPITLELIRGVGSPLAAPSANQFGKISPTTAEHVLEEFDHRVPTLEGGPCTIGIESTIVLATQPTVCTILRPGMIDRAAIQAVVGSQITVMDSSVAAQIKVSGNLDSHYAPSKPTLLCHSYEEWCRLTADHPHAVYTLYFSEAYTKGHASSVLGCKLSADPHQYAQQLYASLRTADHSSAKIIAIEAPLSDIAWDAIGDRLKKSSAKGLVRDTAETSR